MAGCSTSTTKKMTREGAIGKNMGKAERGGGKREIKE